MKINISEYPSSYMVAELDENEKIITEKGAMLYCEGEYAYENKIEAKSIKNWIAKIFDDKSLTYCVYTAKENTKMVFAPAKNAEIFYLEISNNNPIIFEPNLHFARTENLKITTINKDWKSTLNDGLKQKAEGEGKLFLKAYGKIIAQEIDTEKPIYIDEEALIAFEEKLQIKTISKGIKESLTSGEGLVYAITGKGKIWLQTRKKDDSSNGGGLIEGIFSFMK